MSYMEGDFISREIQEVEFLQQKVLEQSYVLEQFLLNGYTEVDQVIDHLHTLYALVEKQHVVYTRMCLSDNPEAKELKQHIRDAAIICGMHPAENVSLFYSEMKRDLKQQICELTGDDFDVMMDPE